jgi:hypothetical protein
MHVATPPILTGDIARQIYEAAEPERQSSFIAEASTKGARPYSGKETRVMERTAIDLQYLSRGSTPR